MDETCSITQLWMRDYGSGSFKIRVKTGAGGSTHEEGVGYVYALSNGARINGTGKNIQAAERKAKRNARIYDALVGGGVDDQNARKTIDRINRGPLANTDPDEIIKALGLKPFELAASQLLPQLNSLRFDGATDAEWRPQPWTTLTEFVSFVRPRMFRSKKLESKRRVERFGRMLCSHVPREGGRCLGDRPISEVRLYMLEDLINDMKERPREGDSEDGDNYLADFKGFVGRLFRRAYNYELINRDFKDGLPSVPRPGKKELTVDDTDVARLFEHAHDPRMKAYLIFGYLGGGLNENLAITTDDIVGNVIRLKAQLGRVDNPNFDKTLPSGPTNPKTICALLPWMKRSARKREFYLTDELMSVVMASIETAPEGSVVYCPQPNLAPDECYRAVRMVIPNQSGGPWQSHNFRLAWNDLCRRAGVQMKPHDFRALLTVDETEDGEDLRVLASMLGHASTDTTERSYLRKRRESRSVKKAFLARADRCRAVMEG